jgi:DNA-binding transcriptional ArsR family regulator
VIKVQSEDPGVGDYVELFRLLGHPLRLSILQRLAMREQSVSEIARSTGQSFSLTSQQLALLRKAGLVRTRRDAKQVFYALACDRLSELAGLVQQLARRSEMGEAAQPGACDRSSAEVGAAMFAEIRSANRRPKRG